MVHGLPKEFWKAKDSGQVFHSGIFSKDLEIGMQAVRTPFYVVTVDAASLEVPLGFVLVKL
jgi:hypothetical protein